MSIVISIIAILISLYSAYRVWSFNETSLRRFARSDFLKRMLDIDAILIEHPELWAIWDDHPPKSTDRLEKYKREAFIYTHLTLFESAFDFYNYLLRKNKVDKDFWETWQRLMLEFFQYSCEARTFWQESVTRDTYLPEFVSFTNNLIKSIKNEA